MPDVIGWASSMILLATIASQIVKQYKEGSSKGVSRWLFLGQIAASVGFVIYSVLVNNVVFIVTNSLILLSAIVGCLITLRAKRREARGRVGEPAS